MSDSTNSKKLSSKKTAVAASVSEATGNPELPPARYGLTVVSAQATTNTADTPNPTEERPQAQRTLMAEAKVRRLTPKEIDALTNEVNESFRLLRLIRDRSWHEALHARLLPGAAAATKRAKPLAEGATEPSTTQLTTTQREKSQVSTEHYCSISIAAHKVLLSRNTTAEELLARYSSMLQGRSEMYGTLLEIPPGIDHFCGRFHRLKHRGASLSVDIIVVSGRSDNVTLILLADEIR